GERIAEIGGFVLEAKRTSAWDAITELLGALESADPGLFQRVMYGCLDLSSPPPEESGFDVWLDDDEQHMFDAAADREARRDEVGYLAPAQARAFLFAARQLRLDGDPPPPSPIAHAYFRAMAPAPAASGPPAPGLPAPLESSGGALPESSSEFTANGDADAI